MLNPSFSPRMRFKKRIILGLTGSFGSGKTTVAKIFRTSGAEVIDADRIAHRLMRPDTAAYKRLINTFGKSILKKNKGIDRNKLGEIVFDDKNLLVRLNRIVHPAVIRIIKNRIATSSKRVIVLDAPLLIEAGLRGLVDKLIVVKIDRKEQTERILRKYKKAGAKTALTRKDIVKRINAQMSLSDKVRMADFVIDNSGTIEKTKKQVGQIIRRRLWKD